MLVLILAVTLAAVVSFIGGTMLGFRKGDSVGYRDGAKYGYTEGLKAYEALIQGKIEELGGVKVDKKNFN